MEPGYREQIFSSGTECPTFANACFHAGRVEQGIVRTEEKQAYQKSSLFRVFNESEPVLGPTEHGFESKRSSLADETVSFRLGLLGSCDLALVFRERVKLGGNLVGVDENRKFRLKPGVEECRFAGSVGASHDSQLRPGMRFRQAYVSARPRGPCAIPEFRPEFQLPPGELSFRP